MSLPHSKLQSLHKEKLNREHRLVTLMLFSTDMRNIRALILRMKLAKGLRRTVEYTIAVGAAVLASYLILQGPW